MNSKIKRRRLICGTLDAVPVPAKTSPPGCNFNYSTYAIMDKNDVCDIYLPGVYSSSYYINLFKDGILGEKPMNGILPLII